MVSEDEIKELIETSFGADVSSYEEDLMDMGVIDSLAAMQLLTILEKKYVIKFPFIL